MQLDLANMSGRELRSLLDTARDRGQAQQSYEILQEMARRRMDEPRPKRRRLGKRAAHEPHLITLDLGDPLAPKDEIWDLPETPSEDAPLVLEREPRQPPPPPPSPPRRRKAPVGVFMTGATIGVVMGAVGGFVGAIASTPAPVAAIQTAEVEAAPLPVGSLAPPPAPPTPEPAPAPAVDPAAVAPAPDQLQLVVASPDAHDAATDVAAAEPPPEPKVEPKPEPKVLKASTETCTAATPADRAICRDPELQKLQKDLRTAYAEALDAHADRAVLRQRQLAWRDARNDVDDPQRLAGLYEQRIRKLEAATAEAKRLQRGG